MTAGRWRAFFAVLSVLLPAAGIAYLGAVSYREDRGRVAERLAIQIRAADSIATTVSGRVERAMEAVALTFRSADEGRPTARALHALQESYPLAAAPFYIDRSGKLRFPSPDPLGSLAEHPQEDLLRRDTRTCPERGFAACVRAVRAGRRRIRQLQQARRLELKACTGKRGCTTDSRAVQRARRVYQRLARYEDTGPDALIGLARLARAVGDRRRAREHYAALGKRFGARYDADGVSYALLADVGAAEMANRGTPRLRVYRKLIARRYHADSSVLSLIARRLRRELEKYPLGAKARQELAGLDKRLAAAHAEAAFSSTMIKEVPEISRAAGPEPVGRPALHSARRTVIYQRAADGGVVGIVVNNIMLAQAASSADVDLESIAAGARIMIERVGVRPDPATTRTLANAGFGATLPHLSLALVNDRSMPDPLDKIVEGRGRRHLAITGGLAALLVLGIAATIRGAARERELARLKSDFVSTVSHELKTPLTSIRMFGEMLQQNVAGADREREARYHAIIVKESQRLGLLIANLLDYSQIERGTRRYNQQNERAVDIAEEAVETFQRFHDESNQAVTISVDDEVADAVLFVDREVVVQALLNLLENAAKYGGADNPIAVLAQERDDQVVLSVRDRGPGIAPAEQSKIFREFYRSPAAYASGVEGTGLGLALVKRHVEAQGGTVELDSAVGRGATFSIVLPAAR
jgi:signal transduction histidine kinase